MAENATMKIDIPGVDFRAMAQSAIAQRLTEALVGADDAIRKIVVAAMGTLVSENGRQSGYSYENKIPFVEWVAQDLVRAATKEVLEKKVERLRPAVEQAVEAALKKSIKPAAQALTENFIAHVKSGFGVTINVAFTQQS